MRRLNPRQKGNIPFCVGFCRCQKGSKSCDVPECTRMYPNVPECTLGFRLNVPVVIVVYCRCLIVLMQNTNKGSDFGLSFLTLFDNFVQPFVGDESRSSIQLST